MEHLLGFVLTPFSWALSMMARMLSASGLLPVFLSIFFVGVVLRLIVRPLVGDSARRSSPSKRSKSTEE